MNIFAYTVIAIVCTVALATFTLIYVESGMAAVESINEFSIPEKWKVLVRTLVFIFNPLIWFVLILALLTYVLNDTYKEFKELITE